MSTNAIRLLPRHGVAAAAAVLLVAACSTQPASRSEAMVAAPQLSGTHWTVATIDGREALPNTELTADFGVDGRVNGDSGCNMYSGSFVQNGATVRFGELLSTRRACLESGRAQQEDRIMGIMNGTTTVQLQGNELQLRGTAGTMTFTNATLAQAQAGVRRDVRYDCQGVPLTAEYRGDRVRLTWPDGIDVLEKTSSDSNPDRIRFESRYSDLLIQRDILWGRMGGNPRSCIEKS